MKINGINQVKPIQYSEGKLPGEKSEPIMAESLKTPDTKDINTVTDNQIGKEDEKRIDDDLLKKSVEQANKSLKQYHRVIERSVHKTTKAVMYTVKNTDTNEVIAEFPPKKIQDMIAKMWELAGLFLDEKA